MANLLQECGESWILVQVVRGGSPQNTSNRNHESTHPLQDGCPFAGKLGCRTGTVALEACEARVANEARVADAAAAATDSSCGHGLGGIQQLRGQRNVWTARVPLTNK